MSITPESFARRVDELIAEKNYFKAEVERSVEQYNSIIDQQLAEIYRLKAEVENSKRINTELLALSNRQASDIRRLRKAGDAMALGIEGDYNYPMPCVQAWNTAKDGKPTE